MADAWLDAWERTAGFNPIIIRNQIDAAFDRMALASLAPGGASYSRSGKRDRLRAPRLHPTKGFRGAHKLFRGGTR